MTLETSLQKTNAETFYAVLHDAYPEGENEQACCMATLVPAPPLPLMGEWSTFSEPYLVACIRNAPKKGEIEWAAYNDIQDWRELIGDALLDEKVEPNEWYWVTIHPKDKSSDPDDDFNEPLPERTCNLDDESCESCQ